VITMSAMPTTSSRSDDVMTKAAPSSQSYCMIR